MQIDSNVAEADIGKIKVGQSVRFTVDAFSGKRFKGLVKQIQLNPINLQNVITSARNPRIDGLWSKARHDRWLGSRALGHPQRWETANGRRCCRGWE